MGVNDWVSVAKHEKIPKRGVLAVYPKGVAILLVRVDDELFAVANKCAHMACPLESGRLDGHLLTCPCHDWRFDVRSGQFVEAPELRITSYSLKVEGGEVLVELAEVPS